MSVFDSLGGSAEKVIEMAGDSLAVKRLSQSGTDQYGKAVTSWEPHSTITGVIFYGTSRTEVVIGSDGRYHQDEPNVLVSLTADVAEGDRVTIRGKDYRVDAITEFPTHREMQTKGEIS